MGYNLSINHSLHRHKRLNGLRYFVLCCLSAITSTINENISYLLTSTPLCICVVIKQDKKKEKERRKEKKGGRTKQNERESDTATTAAEYSVPSPILRLLLSSRPPKQFAVVLTVVPVIRPQHT